jgi:hypothetical protein
MTDQDINMLLGIATLLTTGLLFPFVLHNFKKNERLHEETKKSIGEHTTTLSLHEFRIVSLEQWRLMHNTAQPPGTTTTSQTTVSN